MANAQSALEKLNKKYGIKGNITPTKNNDGKQSTSASSKSSTTTKKTETSNAKSALEKLNEKYGVKGNTSSYKPMGNTTVNITSKPTDFDSETKSAYTTVKNNLNTTTTISNNMSEEQRNARIKEIKAEIGTISTKLSGYSRAKVYGTNKALEDAEKKDKERLSALSQELKDLERTGTFSASETKQFEIDDAKARESAARQKVQSFGQRPSANDAEAYRQANSELFDARKNRNTLEREKAEYERIEKLEELNENTTAVTSKKDFAQNSKYSPAKPKTDAELKAEGYKQAQDGKWYKQENFLSPVEWYTGSDSDLYTYINDPSKRTAIESAQSYNSSKAGYDGSVTIGTSLYKELGYHTLTKDEIGAFNYLYHQDRKNGTNTAEEYLQKISPLLQQRALEKEAEVYKEISKEAPVMASALSLGTNLQNAAMFPVKVGATALGVYDDLPIVDKYGNKTQAIRGAVSEDMPYWGKLVYNGAMSLGDMGVAMVAGGGNAKAIQAIMSSSAGSSTISEAKKNGASDGKALVLGLGSAAIEWATEKYSVEAILKDPKTIKGFILANTFTEATEEGASNISNIALDAIVSEVFGERNEIEQRIDYLVLYEGKSEEEAFKIAVNEKLQSLGEDVLVGGLTGFGMSGIKGSAIGINNAKKNRGVIDTIIKDDESFKALIDEGKVSGEDSTPFALAEVLEKAKADGNLKRGQIKKLIKANDAQIKSEADNTPSVSPEVEEANKKAVEAAFEAGKKNVPRHLINLATIEQQEAYNRGRIEYIKNMKPDNKASDNISNVLSDEKRAVGVADGQAYVSDGKIFIPVDDVSTAKTEYGATESENVGKSVSKLLEQSDFTPVVESSTEGNIKGVGAVRVYTDEKGREIALKKDVADHLEGNTLEATFRGGKPYAIKATDADGNIAGVAMAVSLDTSEQKYELADVKAEASVPYNVMANDNPMLQERQAREAYIANSTGYGQHGVREFANIMETTEKSEAPAVARAFQTAYEAGLTNVDEKAVNLPTNVHRIAFNAGKQDFIAEKARKVENVKNVKSHGDKAGLDATNVPSGVSKQAIDIADRVCKELGVVAQVVGKSDKFNAELTDNVGVVRIASDFTIDESLGEDAVSLSFVKHVLHELADHRAEELAPTEYAEFKREMYNFKNNLEGVSKADIKRQDYGNRGVDISLSEAMSEITANSLLEIYENDLDLLVEGLDRVLNGNNAKAKKGANIFKQALDYVIDKFNKILAKLGGKTKATYKSNVDELTRIRDAFENTLRAAVAKNKEIAKNEVQKNTDLANGGVRFSLKNKNLTIKSQIPFTTLDGYITVAQDDSVALDNLESAVQNVKRGAYTNDATGYSAKITGDTINKAIRPARINGTEFTEEHIRNLNAMIKLPELFKKAVYVDSKPPQKTKSQKKAVKEYHHFVAPVLIGNDTYRALITAREKINSNTLYVLQVEVLPMKKGTLSRQHSKKAGGSRLLSVPSSVSIPELVNGVKIYNYDTGITDIYSGKDIKFSLKDSEGNTLTKEQQEYFKDSKVKDENGNLLVMYQGSAEDFTVFDRKKSSYANLYGRGFYFTKSENHASQYGNTRAYYLNIKHPVSTTETAISETQLRKFLEAVAENEDYSFENYGYGATVDSVLQSTYGKTDFLMLNDVSQTAIGDLVEAVELFNEVNGTNYDGIILATETVTFNSEQAKLTSNKNPTSNPDTRYSLKDSEGNTLTNEQAEFFKDSKIRVSEVDGWKNTITENGALFPVYHGTNSDEFYEFDEGAIGSANDRGWFGKGFYFAFTEDEASYYGSRVLKCYLNVKKPFIYSEEMESFDGQSSGDVNFDFASFIINVADKFPEIAQKAYVDVAEQNSDEIVERSFADFAKEIKNVYNSDRLTVVEVDDHGETIYQYRYSRDVDSIDASEKVKNIIKTHYVDSLWVADWLKEKGTITEAEYEEITEVLDKYDSNHLRDKWLYTRFNSQEQAEKNRLSAAVLYLREHKYSYIDQHMPHYYMMHFIGESLTNEIRKRGYDGVLQSRSGDEVVVFKSNQIKLTSNKNPTSNPDINYSLKGTEKDIPLKDIPKVRKAAAERNAEVLAKYVDSGAISTEVYQQLIEEFGAIHRGENPSRDVQVPQRTAKDKKVSQTVRTILEAEATPDEAVPTIEKMVEDGVFSYDVYTDKQAIADAEAYIKEYGWEETLLDWFEAVNKGEVSKELTTTGWALYNNAANKAATATDADVRKEATKTAIRILDAMVRHQRSAAQALQATRILKKLSPETQLYGVQKSVEAFRKELTEKYGDKAPDLEIDTELAEQFLQAETDEERASIEEKIYKDIGRQMPSRFIDKWNAWRYLAMLGNPRTHVRNIFGNLFFAPVVGAKNLTATAIESAVYRVSGKKMLRGKALVWGSKADRALLKAAWGDYKNVADLISNGGKYNDSAVAKQQIEAGRRIFKFKPLEWARKGNSELLEGEDMLFSKPHYAYALAQYCKANNITAEQIAKGKAISPAREYAIKEAQKATYRDTNAFSQMVSEWGRSKKNEKNVVKKAFNTVVEGILPFRKTPANILVRGIEYSPIGLIKGLSYDLRQVSKGKMSASEAIDNISAGLTGTGLLALGVYLAAQGLIRGHGEDEEKEKKFKEMQGHQAYSLELPNGESITLDWLAPEALPFFVGVNLWETTSSESDEVNLSSILQSVSRISEPMLEMSCLQSLNDLFESIGNASSNDTSGLMSVLSSAATSYLTQGLPTILGQSERTSEEERMTTYTEKNGFLTGDMQYTLGKASAKIPFWDYNQIPYIDAWGRKEASGTALKRGFNNFLNPAYTSTIESSDMENELLRLYEQTGEGGVFPDRADKKFKVDGEEKHLTAEEYVRYATLKGEKSYKLVSDLVNSKAYKNLSDEEKVKAIKETYDYANQKAKQAISNYKPETWVTKADEFGSNVGNYISFKTEVASTKKANDNKISKTEVADIILDMAQNDSEIWKLYLSEYDGTNDLYAFDNGIDGETYMYFLESLNDSDEPTKSGKYGTYTQEEAKKAVNQLDGLSRDEKAILWQSVNPTWKKNPYK